MKNYNRVIKSANYNKTHVVDIIVKSRYYFEGLNNIKAHYVHNVLHNHSGIPKLKSIGALIYFYVSQKRLLNE